MSVTISPEQVKEIEEKTREQQFQDMVSEEGRSNHGIKIKISCSCHIIGTITDTFNLLS